MQESALGTYNAEVATGEIRRDELDGRPHIVAPVVAVRSMVLKGEYLPDEEIQSSAPAWNGRPLPIGHPTENGEFTSANDPAVLSEQNVGRFFGATAADDDAGGSKLTGELWVDIEKSTRLGGDAAEPLRILASHADADVLGDDVDADVDVSETENAAGDLLEVSTAYFYQPETEQGIHNGEQYNAVQRNLRPDHLALLPNERGECSVEDGCGAPRAHVHHAAADVGGEVDADTDSSDGSSPDATEQTDTDSRSPMSETENDDIAWLTEHSAFEAEALEAMSDDELSALKETVDATQNDATDDTPCECGGHNGEQANDHDDPEPSANDDGDGSQDDDHAPEVAALVERVEELESELAAQKRAEREDYVDTIVANSDRFGDDDREELAGMETAVLEALAEDYEQAAAQTPADMSGRIGAANHTGGDDAAEEYTGLAAKLAGSSPSPEAGDD